MLFDSPRRYRLQTILSSLCAPALLFCSILCGTAAMAAPTEEQRWYDVEVIIFSQNSQQYRESELWPLDYDLPQAETAQELLPAPAPVVQQADKPPVAFSRLNTDSLRLSAEAGRIDAAPDTELLLHIGWRQPGLAEDKAVAVRVDDSMQEKPEAKQQSADNTLSSEEEPQRMEGTLKLVLSRYLHIYTDLILREPLAEGSSAFEPVPIQSDTDLFAIAEDPFGFQLQPSYQVYHLQQSRRMRSKELHYLDHPVLGMAILVTPYEIKEAETAAPQ